MHKYLYYISDIFFESKSEQSDIFSPQELTEHYRTELDECYLDAIYVASSYRQARDIIETYKYKSDRQCVSICVDLLAKLVEEYNIVPTQNVSLVGVPMHWSRYMIRGFNHIDLLVSKLSKHIGIPSLKPIQAHWTRRQSQLSKDKRIKNRENAFSLNHH